MSPTAHVVGAGIAGLSAAIRLAEAGHKVALYEAAPAAGGRCRSYYDQALDLVIDNGNHLLLSGNTAALDYLGRIGSLASLHGPDTTVFDFADLSSGERWRLRPNAGRIPWWLLASARRVPRTAPWQYLSALRLLRAPPTATVPEIISCAGALYERLWRPILLAGLNTEPREASATLAAAILRETLGAGGGACRPLVALQGLSKTYVEPALEFLSARNVAIRFGMRLCRIAFGKDRAVELEFGSEREKLASDDVLIIAVPPWVAKDLLPGLEAPDAFRAIMNAHFRMKPPRGHPVITATLGGLTEWLFAYPEHLSVTISSADALLGRPREKLAAEIWGEVVALTDLSAKLPPWQIVKERRATFAATPAQDAKRPPVGTRWRNVMLAGDWTQTGLPATIEGAVRSGYGAASLILGTPCDMPQLRKIPSGAK
ncbi:MAG: FAD-dependent oxidoreductase [Hyphomicrobiales bacterium]|nr:FAD-dependent oxidoreductase [Hyphomicrobiales bacterium]